MSLHSIDGGGTKDTAAEEFRKAQEAFRQLQANMQTILENQILLAKIQRGKYEALIAEGFTKEEALALIK